MQDSSKKLTCPLIRYLNRKGSDPDSSQEYLTGNHIGLGLTRRRPCAILNIKEKILAGPKQNSLTEFKIIAPVRINDIGGWTDTWFAGSGKVLNIAVDPGVEIHVKTYPNPAEAGKRVTIHALNYGARFTITPESPVFDLHPILQAAVYLLPPPMKIRTEISVKSHVPAGSATGTSASVCVALIGALGRIRGESLSADTTASLAHRVETEILGYQSGIQDQIAAARGGICFINMHEYPHSRTENLFPSQSFLIELQRRIRLFFLGNAHSSSAVHEEVIADLEEGGSARFEILGRLKELAGKAKEAVRAEDLEALGNIMVENNTCQERLHHKLISPDAKKLIRTARESGASGWKVNGAGGEGGSVTILGPGNNESMIRMIQRIDSMGKGIRMLPVKLNHTGLLIEPDK